MDKKLLEQFLNWLREQRDVAQIGTRRTLTNSWYIRGYQDAVRRIEEMYRIAFRDAL